MKRSTRRPPALHRGGHLRINSNIPFGLAPCDAAGAGVSGAASGNHPGYRFPPTPSSICFSSAPISPSALGRCENPACASASSGPVAWAVVASPDYLARHGTPQRPDDLVHHRGIGWTFFRTIGGWPFRSGQGIEAVSAPPIARASDGRGGKASRARRRWDRAAGAVPYQAGHRGGKACAGVGRIQSR